jgi:Tol biopolymer transport system component
VVGRGTGRSSGIRRKRRQSPDGSRLAFQSRRDGNAEVYVMAADGGGQTNLTNNPATDGEPNWSPNGGAVLCSSPTETVATTSS